MQRGTVAVSTAGHDRGKRYVVIEVSGGFAHVCDGKNRKLVSPKKKNIRHLCETGEYIELSVYNPLLDAHIKKELNCLLK